MYHCTGIVRLHNPDLLYLHKVVTVLYVHSSVHIYIHSLVNVPSLVIKTTLPTIVTVHTYAI